MLMLRLAPRGHALAWMACGCIVAAESFASGLSEWHRGSLDNLVMPRSIPPTVGKGSVYALTRDGATA
ncbi:hypothetical protein [Paraburkholderia caledonica]|uniref:hypothetical protein n=1 Tax=Paraburkholderia caledonica TaxID=134536 RepID=UPI001260257F|nr:hypothetical protein [Paraburkholderia caledonica]